jgi:signal transduction histidine kinase
MISRQERLVFETQRLERLEAAERAALGQAEQSRDEAERARGRAEASALAEQAARAQAEDALATRDIFLRMLAHDLTTPLVVLTWHVQLLRESLNNGPIDRAYLESALESVSARTAEAAAAIEELHDLTRAAAGARLALDRKQVDIAEKVRQVVAELPPSPVAEVRFEGEESGVLVDADPVRLARIIRNVLDNAIKYSPKGGVVVVSVQTVGDWADVRVTDHGLGIPADDLPHVFERYRRGTNVEHTYGEGLGLASVRHLVELHGGQVLVESEVGVGSTFTVRLPLAR